MSSDPPRVELYLRSLAPTASRAPQDEIVRRLEDLEAAGKIRGYTVRLCGDCVCPEAATADSEPGRRLLSRYRSFEAWAGEHDRELSSFEERDIDSLLTGTSITGIVFPQITLAEFEDGDLTFVAPSSNGADETSVRERLERY